MLLIISSSCNTFSGCYEDDDDDEVILNVCSKDAYVLFLMLIEMMRMSVAA